MMIMTLTLVVSPSRVQHPATPPYIHREAMCINQLESTVQRIASDLTNNNEQIKEVKELLLRLINSLQSAPNSVTPSPPLTKLHFTTPRSAEFHQDPMQPAKRQHTQGEQVPAIESTLPTGAGLQLPANREMVPVSRIQHTRLADPTDPVH